MSYRDLAERFFAALKVGDFDAMGALVTPDFVCREPAGLPYGGDHVGIEGWRKLTGMITATWAGFRLERLEFHGETADSLVLRLFIKGRSRRTGTPFETSVLELWRFRDGLLCEITPHYFDTHALAVANG
jgi:ketosteroid isomerase-like protein